MNKEDEIKWKFSSIEDAIEDIKNGKVLIVVDDEDRENEGDFICAAEKVTPDIVNFMARYGRGLICAPIERSRAKDLDLDLMVSNNTALHETAFTVSVDYLGKGCTTGISAYDRFVALQALADETTKSTDLSRPGHIFPLVARDGGVLRRSGHTEAAVDLAKMAGLYPAGVLIEILNEDGTMARLPQLMEMAEEFDLNIICIKDLIAYRLRKESIVKELEVKEIDTKYGAFNVHTFEQITTGDLHYAFVKGEIKDGDTVPVKVYSNRESNDILQVFYNDKIANLNKSLAYLKDYGQGVFLYMCHHQEPTTMMDQIMHYQTNRMSGLNSDEQRDIGVGAQILKKLNLTKIKLISNSSKKRIGITSFGLNIVENIEF